MDVMDVDQNFVNLLIIAAIIPEFDKNDDHGIHDEDDPIIWEKVTVDVNEYLNMQDAAFRLHFRMSTEMFEELTGVVADFIGEENIRRRNQDFPLRHILLMVIWILATPDTFRSVALRFGVTPGVAHHHYKTMITALSLLAEVYVVWPNEHDRQVLKETGERRAGFPGVVGAVDGTCIPLCYAPFEEPQRYFNRNHDYSVTLQGTVDITLAFRDIYAGEPGSLHDSRVFRRSPLCRRILENNILALDEHILGDSAYILTDKVLTPFRRHGPLTVEQQNYNYRLCSLRSMVERAFGLLKQKWRRLFFLSAKRMELTVRTIVASVMLHNFLVYHGEMPDEDVQDVQEPGNQGENNDNEWFDEDLELNEDAPNLEVEPDHPLLDAARFRGIEKRLHIMHNLPM